MVNKDVLLDKEQVDNLRQLFSDGFEEFVQTYFNDFEQKENELILALKNKKIENIIKIAHALKGSSLNMGASALAKACYELEMAGKRGDFKEITDDCDAIQKIYPKTKEAFFLAIH